MASRLQQLLSRAKTVVDPLYSTLRSQTVKQYDSLMAKNAQYVVKDPAAEEKLLRQWFFSKMARQARIIGMGLWRPASCALR